MCIYLIRELRADIIGNELTFYSQPYVVQAKAECDHLKNVFELDFFFYVQRVNSRMNFMSIKANTKRT